MALSSDEQLAVFEVLGVIYPAITPGEMTGHDGTIIRAKYVTLDELKDKVLAYIAGLDSVRIARVQGLLALWAGVRVAPKWVPQNVGDVQGMTLNLEQRRADIIHLLQTYIPIKTLAQIQQLTDTAVNGDDDGFNVMVKH